MFTFGRGENTRRTFVFTAVVIILASSILSFAGFQQAQAIPTFTLTPTEGFAQSTITARGYGFPTSNATNNYSIRLRIIWGATPVGTIGTAQIDAAGSFQFQLNNPGYPYFTIVADLMKNSELEDSFAASFKTLPTLILNPPVGPVGTEFNVDGYGFPVITDYTISWMGQPVALVVPVSSKWGVWGIKYTVPNVASGDYLVEASDNSGVLASATFTVLSSPTPTPTSTPITTPIATPVPTPTPVQTPVPTATPGSNP